MSFLKRTAVVAIVLATLTGCTPSPTPEQIKQQACIDTLDKVAVWAELTAAQREDLIDTIDCTPPREDEWLS